MGGVGGFGSPGSPWSVPPLTPEVQCLAVSEGRVRGAFVASVRKLGGSGNSQVEALLTLESSKPSACRVGDSTGAWEGVAFLVELCG